jgi:hypothetical protein
MMIAVNQVVVTAPALRADVANTCCSFHHLGRTARSAGSCSIIETDKATGDKNPCDVRQQGGQTTKRRLHL